MLAKGGSCLRRNFGCIIVKDNKIISRGQTKNLQEMKPCFFCNRNDSPSGKNYDFCQSIHAEQEALLNVSLKQAKGSILFLVGLNSDLSIMDKPYICNTCKKFIIKNKIRKVILGLPDNNCIIITRKKLVFVLERELFCK